MMKSMIRYFKEKTKKNLLIDENHLLINEGTYDCIDDNNPY